MFLNPRFLGGAGTLHVRQNEGFVFQVIQVPVASIGSDLEVLEICGSMGCLMMVRAAVLFLRFFFCGFFGPGGTSQAHRILRPR